MEWLFDNIGAAVVGLFVGGIVAVVIGSARRAWAHRRRTLHMTRDAGPNQARVIRFLRDIGQRDEVYRPELVAVGHDLPILVHPALRFDVDVRDTRATLVLEDTAIDQLPEDERVIAQRRTIGTELWNGDVIYVAGADLGSSPPSIRLRRSTYFAYVTAVDRIVKGLWARRPARSRIPTEYGSVAAALGSTEPRLWLSGAVVTLIEQENASPMVIIHRRSSGVVNAPGIRTVAPVFGFDAAMIGDTASGLGIALYNVAREYGEELFDKELIVRANRANWFHPDQVIEAVEEISVFLEDLESGTVQVTLTGMCVNPKDCDLSLAFLAEINCGSKSAELLGRMRGGWEAEAGNPGHPGVEVLDLFDARLDDWAASGQLYPTSVFALDRARAIVRARATGAIA